MQTLLVDGSLSNVSAPELGRYFANGSHIQPTTVQIYSIDRPVPEKQLVRVPPLRLREIARRAEAQTRIPFRVFWA